MATQRGKIRKLKRKASCTHRVFVALLTIWLFFACSLTAGTYLATNQAADSGRGKAALGGMIATPALACIGLAGFIVLGTFALLTKP